MTVRFRIRTSAGQELSFASREMFEDFVRSGDLSPDDLVYDGETGSWSPARTHPAVLDIQYELEAEGEGDADAEATRSASQTEDAGAEKASADDSFGLSLAPEQERPEEPEAGTSGANQSDPGDSVGSGPEQESGGGAGEDLDLEFDLALTEELSPEDAKKVFLQKLEAEREVDLDAGPSIREGLSGFASETLAPRADPPPPRAPEPPPRAPDPPPRTRSSSSTSRSEAEATPKGPGKKKDGLGRALLRVALLVLLVGGGYVAYQLLAEDPEAVSDDDTVAGESPVEPVAEAAEPDPEAEPVEPEPPREPVIPSTQAAVRERAQERYLTSTQAALRDLQPIPEVWPEGPYLAVPSRYPGILDIWQDYRSTIRAVRDDDRERYRAAFSAALDDAAVPAEGRQERIDAALEDFTAGSELREAHFDRVEALATAAIQSHNALMEAEGLILYDPTGTTGQGLGQGTSARTDEAQLLLNQVVELLTAALDADGEGPGSGENVREWVWDGFLDAATR